MALQTITTTYQEPEFEQLLRNCIAGIIKTELAHLVTTGETIKEILTRQEAAELLNISLPTLHDYTKRGIIQACRIGYKVRYKREDVLNALSIIKYRR